MNTSGTTAVTQLIKVSSPGTDVCSPGNTMITPGTGVGTQVLQ